MRYFCLSKTTLCLFFLTFNFYLFSADAGGVGGAPGGMFPGGNGFGQMVALDYLGKMSGQSSDEDLKKIEFLKKMSEQIEILRVEKGKYAKGSKEEIDIGKRLEIAENFSKRSYEQMGDSLKNPMLYTLKTECKRGFAMGFRNAIAEVIMSRFKKVPGYFSSLLKVAKRAYQRAMYRAEDFSWQYLVSLNDKVFGTLKPLVIQSTGSVLAREKRLRILDEEGEAEVDEEWQNIATMTKRELSMVVDALKRSIPCYEKQQLKDKNFMKKCVCGISQEMSLTRNSEVVDYTNILIDYLNLVIESCEKTKSFEVLDKDYIKKLLGRIGDTFEHIGFLVDEESSTSGSNRRSGFMKLNMSEQPRFDSSSSYGGSSYGGGLY